MYDNTIKVDKSTLSFPFFFYFKKRVLYLYYFMQQVDETHLLLVKYINIHNFLNQNRELHIFKASYKSLERIRVTQNEEKKMNTTTRTYSYYLLKFIDEGITDEIEVASNASIIMEYNKFLTVFSKFTHL